MSDPTWLEDWWAARLAEPPPEEFPLDLDRPLAELAEHLFRRFQLETVRYPWTRPIIDERALRARVIELTLRRPGAVRGTPVPRENA